MGFKMRAIGMIALIILILTASGIASGVGPAFACAVAGHCI
jgi:hypothetical protein